MNAEGGRKGGKKTGRGTGAGENLPPAKCPQEPDLRIAEATA